MKKQNAIHESPPRSRQQSKREASRADALRENLRKRKVQQQVRATTTDSKNKE